MTRPSCGFVILLVALVGCGSDRPETAPVSGKVTMRGKAIEGATVTFRPAGKEGGRPAFATTDAEGFYELSTFGSGDGAIPGEYDVTIEKVRVKGSFKEQAAVTPQPPKPGEKADYSAYMAAMSGKVKTVESSGEVPPKYASSETSGLKREVVGGEENPFDFDLTP